MSDKSVGEKRGYYLIQYTDLSHNFASYFLFIVIFIHKYVGGKRDAITKGELPITHPPYLTLSIVPVQRCLRRKSVLIQTLFMSHLALTDTELFVNQC